MSRLSGVDKAMALGTKGDPSHGEPVWQHSTDFYEPAPDKWVVRSRVQRDNRTTIRFKAYLLWLGLVLSVFLVIVGGGSFKQFDECERYETNSSAGHFENFYRWTTLLIAIAGGVYGILCIYGITHPDYMWRTNNAMTLARDEQDHDAGYLGRAADSIRESSTQTLDDVDDVYDRTIMRVDDLIDA
jgi:hypothetical protein